LFAKVVVGFDGALFYCFAHGIEYFIGPFQYGINLNDACGRVGEKSDLVEQNLLSSITVSLVRSNGLVVTNSTTRCRTSCPKRKVSGNKRGVGIKPTRLSRYIGYTPVRGVLIKASTPSEPGV
jgi:hypothetical protein